VDGREAGALGLVLLAVMIFTTPWDNLAAKWASGDSRAEKYSLRIGYLPVEEYAFFLLQSLNVMLGVRALFHFLPIGKRAGNRDRKVDPHLSRGSVIPWVIVALNLRWLSERPAQA